MIPRAPTSSENMTNRAITGTVRCVVEPAVVVRIMIDSRLAETAQHATGVAVASEHQQTALVIGHQLAECLDVVRIETFRWKGSGVQAVCFAIEGRGAMISVHKLRPGVDYEPLARIGIL